RVLDGWSEGDSVALEGYRHDRPDAAIEVAVEIAAPVRRPKGCAAINDASDHGDAHRVRVFNQRSVDIAAYSRHWSWDQRIRIRLSPLVIPPAVVVGGTSGSS